MSHACWAILARGGTKCVKQNDQSREAMKAANGRVNINAEALSVVTNSHQINSNHQERNKGRRQRRLWRKFIDQYLISARRSEAIEMAIIRA